MGARTLMPCLDVVLVAGYLHLQNSIQGITNQRPPEIMAALRFVRSVCEREVELDLAAEITGRF
jgi:hypothetical protein